MRILDEKVHNTDFDRVLLVVEHLKTSINFNSNILVRALPPEKYWMVCEQLIESKN